MKKEEFIEKIKDINVNAPDEMFFLEYNKIVYDILEDKENLIKYIEEELNLIDNVYLLEEIDEDVRRHLLTKEDIFKNLLERIKSGKYE